MLRSLVGSEMCIRDSNTPAKHCGDEPKLIHRRTGAPVAVDPIRANAVKALLENGVDIIITDDGLQHYALERDIEFVIVDGNRRFGNESLIPLGPLREGVERLAEVDFIITNGGQAQQGEMPMSLAPSKAINLKTKQQVEISELRDLVAFAGIGHPPRFFNTLNAMNADVKVTKGFADHQDFDQQELQALAQQGACLLYTSPSPRDS